MLVRFYSEFWELLAEHEHAGPITGSIHYFGGTFLLDANNIAIPIKDLCLEILPIE